MAAYTSLIMPAGVEAPAVRPATEQPLKKSGGSSSAFSTWTTFSELSDDPNAKPEDVVKVGDEIETYIVRLAWKHRP